METRLEAAEVKSPCTFRHPRGSALRRRRPTRNSSLRRPPLPLPTRSRCAPMASVTFVLVFSFKIQGDTSGCSQGLVDISTNVECTICSLY